MSLLSNSLLAQTIDDCIAWIATWTRFACYETQDRADQEKLLATPESFIVWRKEAAKTLQDQPAIDRLVELYDQLQRLTRLTLLKVPDGAPISSSDYEAVSLKYQEFIIGLRRLERALATAASGLDTLTGLRSRAGMRDDLTKELSRFQRSGKPFCVALMDLDYFKKVNDIYGHESGDRILSAVANLISRSLRQFDDAWRWGGEEFLLCLKEADLAAGQLVLERLHTSLQKLPIKIANGDSISITASFGLAPMIKGLSLDELLAQADKALYRAKAAGRNRIEVSSLAS